MKKKGQVSAGVASLATITILLVIAGVVIVMGLDVTSSSADTGQFCSNSSGTWNSSNRICINSTGQADGWSGLTNIANASLDTTQGISNISAKFALLGTIVIVGVILSALAGFLAFRAR